MNEKESESIGNNRHSSSGNSRLFVVSVLSKTLDENALLSIFLRVFSISLLSPYFIKLKKKNANFFILPTLFPYILGHYHPGQGFTE